MKKIIFIFIILTSTLLVGCDSIYNHYSNECIEKGGIPLETERGFYDSRYSCVFFKITEEDNLKKVDIQFDN